MDLNKTLEKINSDRHKAECGFVFSLWKDPELYLDYMNLNEGKDETLKNKDAVFYYNLGKAMYSQGFRNFDPLSVDTFLSKKDAARKRFEEMGGYASIEELKDIAGDVNVEAYFDIIAKKNYLSYYAVQCEDTFTHLDRFESATSEDIYNTFELMNDSLSIATGNNVKIENLVIDNKFIEDCDKGTERGLDYGKACPILNYLTLGIPRGELTLIAAHSGVGKTSFSFENFILPLNAQGVKTAIISNEMRADAYKNMLTSHILVHDLKYWDITRKKLKTGGFSEEQMKMIKEAQKISKEKYSNINFVKMFDNEIDNIVKYIRKLINQGNELIVLDTLKMDDTTNENFWISLIQNSRKIFQLASKYNVAIVATYQLALHSTNTRFLDAGCLSNAKQIKEVCSEILMFRKIWKDEFSGKKFDCKPYKMEKDENGKYQKTMIELDEEKTYVICFHDKGRSDESGKQIIYEVNFRFNVWREVGYAVVINTHS